MRININSKTRFNDMLQRIFNNEKIPVLNGCSTDSRNIHKNDLFLPIKGVQFDGHDFIDDAIKNGACLVLTEKDINESYSKAELGWFISDLCLTLGMIGTVAGFIYMLSSSFANIDVSNVSSLQNVLAHMSAGMATALYTTAAGLVSSAFLKIQYFNYSAEVDRLGTEIDDSKKA